MTRLHKGELATVVETQYSRIPEYDRLTVRITNDEDTHEWGKNLDWAGPSGRIYQCELLNGNNGDEEFYFHELELVKMCSR